MIEKTGDMFTTDANILAHGVNVFGVMGSGIAVEFKKRFPENFIDYHKACDSGILVPGDAFITTNNDFEGRKVAVANLASQSLPGPDARYEWLFPSLHELALEIRETSLLAHYGSVVAIPEIGCGIGGLEWSKARIILLAIEKMYPGEIEFEVWHYNG